MRKIGISIGLLVMAMVAAPASRGQAAPPVAGSTAKVAAKPAVYPVEEGFVDAHGVLIYYTTVGRGAPLVIVHGGPGASHDYFLPYLLPLARHNRLIFIDERGSGKSEKLTILRDTPWKIWWRMWRRCALALGLGKINLLGHSFGGVLAQAYALKYQQNLSHLISAAHFPARGQINEVFVQHEAKHAAGVARADQAHGSGRIIWAREGLREESLHE